jgi:hypothetical protein
MRNYREILHFISKISGTFRKWHKINSINVLNLLNLLFNFTKLRFSECISSFSIQNVISHQFQSQMSSENQIFLGKTKSKLKSYQFDLPLIVTLSNINIWLTFNCKVFQFRVLSSTSFRLSIYRYCPTCPKWKK